MQQMLNGLCAAVVSMITIMLQHDVRVCIYTYINYEFGYDVATRSTQECKFNLVPRIINRCMLSIIAVSSHCLNTILVYPHICQNLFILMDFVLDMTTALEH